MKKEMLRDQTIMTLLARESLIENPGGTIVTSITVSMAMDEIVEEKGGKLIKVHLDNVLEEIVKNEAVFEGDDSGMYVFPEFQRCFVAIFAAVRMLEIVCKRNTTLSAIIKEILEYPRTIFSVEVEHEDKNKVLTNLRDNLSPESKIDATKGVKIQEEDPFCFS